MTTIYCPACGQLAAVVKVDTLELTVRCPNGHGFVMMVDELLKGNILGFQCDGTEAYQLPEAKEVN